MYEYELSAFSGEIASNDGENYEDALCALTECISIFEENELELVTVVRAM